MTAVPVPATVSVANDTEPVKPLAEPTLTVPVSVTSGNDRAVPVAAATELVAVSSTGPLVTAAVPDDPLDERRETFKAAPSASASVAPEATFSPPRVYEWPASPRSTVELAVASMVVLGKLTARA